MQFRVGRPDIGLIEPVRPVSVSHCDSALSARYKPRVVCESRSRPPPTPVYNIWSMFQDAQMAATIWENSMRVNERKRNPDGTETSSQSSRHTAQSAACTCGGNIYYDKAHMRSRRKYPTAGSGELGGRSTPSKQIIQSTERKHIRSESTLNMQAVLRLHGGHNSEHPHKRIKKWLVSQGR